MANYTGQSFGYPDAQMIYLPAPRIEANYILSFEGPGETGQENQDALLLSHNVVNISDFKNPKFVLGRYKSAGYYQKQGDANDYDKTNNPRQQRQYSRRKIEGIPSDTSGSEVTGDSIYGGSFGSDSITGRSNVFDVTEKSFRFEVIPMNFWDWFSLDDGVKVNPTDAISVRRTAKRTGRIRGYKGTTFNSYWNAYLRADNPLYKEGGDQDKYIWSAPSNKFNVFNSNGILRIYSHEVRPYWI